MNHFTLSNAVGPPKLDSFETFFETNHTNLISIYKEHMNFILGTMSFILDTMNFILGTRSFTLLTMSFILGTRVLF